MKIKKISIAVIGLGYVGIPLCFALSKKYKVIGYDINSKIVDNLKKNKSHIEDIKPKDLINNKKIKFTSNFNYIKHCNVFIVCVPTPIFKNNSPDNSYLCSVKNMLGNIDLKNKIIINESTTYPGATREIFEPVFLNQKLKLGKNCYLSFSPERVDPGNISYKTENIPKLVSGVTSNCLKFVSQIYEKIFKIYKVSNIETAEFTKVYENVFRSINISFVNEMKVLSHKMNIDIYEVIKAASTKPFGFMPFYPGPGFGGHCIPIDPYLLAWKAKEYNFYTRFIELSGQINESMPNYIVSNLIRLIVEKKFDLKNIKILIIGLSYKKNSFDTRETPASKIIQLLKKYQTNLYYHDDLINKQELKKNKIFDKITYSSLDKKNLKHFSACLILADHDYIDYTSLQKNCKLIVDTRGRFENKYKNVTQL